MNLLAYFPDNYTPLPHQVDILTKASQALNSHVRYIIVAAPTGTGKSFIAKCIANKTDDHSEEFKEVLNTNLVGTFLVSKYVAKEIAAGLYDTTDGCCKYTIEVDARYYGIGCPGYDYETGLDYEYQVKEKEVIRSLENEMESDGRDML